MSSARTRPRFLTVLVTVGLIAGFVLSAPAPTRVLADPPVPTIAVHYDNALPGEFYGRVATHDWPVGISLTLTVERWNESLEPPAFEQAYTELADSGPEYPFLQGHDGTDPFFVERGDRVTVTDGTTTKVHDVYSLLLEAIDHDEEIVSGSSDSPDSVCVDLWSLPGPPRQCADPVGGAWLVDFPNTSDYDITPYSDLAAWQYDIDGDATTMNNHLLREPEPPDPGLRAQLMSSGLGVDVEGWNWAWDETSGVKVELFAPSGSVPIATADGFPSPLEHGHHFWVAFDTTFGPNYRIVATGYDSDITREVIVRDIRISHTDRLARHRHRHRGQRRPRQRHCQHRRERGHQSSRDPDRREPRWCVRVGGRLQDSGGYRRVRRPARVPDRRAHRQRRARIDRGQVLDPAHPGPHLGPTVVGKRRLVGSFGSGRVPGGRQRRAALRAPTL